MESETLQFVGKLKQFDVICKRCDGKAVIERHDEGEYDSYAEWWNAVCTVCEISETMPYGEVVERQ